MAYYNLLDFLKILLGAMIVVGIAETALKASWNRLYFTLGLPIFIRRVPVSVFRISPVDTASLEAEFASSFTSRALLFKELETNLYAFREKMMEFRFLKTENTEVMHGVLIFDLNQQQVIVKGYLNWVIVVLVLGFIGFAVLSGSVGWLMIIFLVVIVGIGYAAQAGRYGKVAQKAAELISAPRKTE